MTDNVTLPTNQQRAITALLEEKTVRAAAQRVKLSEKTIYRYLGQAEFRKALQGAQAAIYSEITNRLTVGTNTALDKLENLIKSAQSEAVQRAAIADWLTYALKVYELQSLEARISALEARMT